MLKSLLPRDGDLWLCVVFGSAARNALGPRSDVDVVAEGLPEAIDAWQGAAQQAVGREVSVYSVSYMLRQPMMVAEILDGPVVLRDTRGRLAEMQAESEKDGRLPAFLLRMLRDALMDYEQPGPSRNYSGTERRFMEALAATRSERKRLQSVETKALERLWATERATRWIRNLLRDWPGHGNYQSPRAALDRLQDSLSPQVIQALRLLPYEEATGNPVDLQVDPRWIHAEQLLTPTLDELVERASDALRASIARS